MLKTNKLCLSLIVLGGFLAGMPKAQAQGGQQESVADAARRAREQKKDAPRPATVITNDTLQPAPAVSPAASSAAPAPVSTNAAPGPNPISAATPDAATGGQTSSTPAEGPANQETTQDKAAQQAELTALKKQIAEMQGQVDLAQRVLALANDDFYSRPDFSKDEDGKAKLDALKSEVTQKLDALAELKAKLPADAATDEKPAEGQSQPTMNSSSETQTQTESQP